MWVEISGGASIRVAKGVTPLAGVWVEITSVTSNNCAPVVSLPLRECGLKSAGRDIWARPYPVTPLAGVWVEMGRPDLMSPSDNVTPLAGVWVEMHLSNLRYSHVRVTPLAGVMLYK